MARKPDLTAKEVMDICASYMNEDQLKFVEKSLDYATKAHEGQMRMSGEPYIIHPIQVAGILAQLGMDTDTVAAGFLHDVVEDTDHTLEDIAENFNEATAFIVDGVTKLGKIRFQSKEEALAENHRKMLLAMAKDMRIIIVKLADRLHNMRTMKFQKPEKQIEKSEEALEVYAPLADRLGMNIIKWELEDTSLRYLNPGDYYNIVKLMKVKRNEREAYIQEAIDVIEKSLKETGIEGEVYGRPKHLYSIYRKMTDQNKEFDDIYDLLAIRILVHDVKDCYAALGIIHTKWKPLPGRFKDYIAMPKANMYQSLHTTVIGPLGKPIEIQIRTYEMHDVAENGVAAHWAYKQGRTQAVKPEDNIQRQLKWFRDLVELQDDARDASEFMDFVKEDIFKDLVYVFSPQGDVFELPKGAGPIDFAYNVHSEVGDKTVGAKVNGRIVTLNYKLKTGDIVEILTNPNSGGPSRDWIKFASTSKARNKIRRHFKIIDAERNRADGQELLEDALKQEKIPLRVLSTRSSTDEILKRFNHNKMEELYVSIGVGDVPLTTVVNYIRKQESDKAAKMAPKVVSNTETIQKDQHHNNRTKPNESGVIVKGMDGLMVRLSRCCNPVPGDPIIGYITRGRGISVHRVDCNNLLTDPEYKERTIEVAWQNTAASEDYETELQIAGFDRSGLMNDVLNVINHTVRNLKGINGRITDDGMAVLTVTVSISNVSQLEDLIRKLSSVPDVYEVERVVG